MRLSCAKRLWLWLAGLVVCGQLVLVGLTQDSSEDLFFSLLIWAGALVCSEAQLRSLIFKPTSAGLLAGSVLLCFGFWRSSRVLHLDAAAPMLPPVLGLALVLLAEPPRQINRWWAPLTVLTLMPFPWLLSRLLPEGPFTLLTARVTQLNLLLLGLDSALSGPVLMLNGGGVRVAGGCTGLPLIAQMTAIAVVFALAFPLPTRAWQLAMTLGAPLMGLQVNSLRIAVLAMISASGWPNKSWWFDFFHEHDGALVFTALSVGLFAWLYIALLDQQLRARAAQKP